MSFYYLVTAAQIIQRLLSDRLTLLWGFALPIDTEVIMLGKTYRATPQSIQGMQTSFLEDFESRVYLTARRSFWGPAGTSTDLLWSSNARSMQMLMAQSLLYIELGRSWRRNLNSPSVEFAKVVRMFMDDAGACLSIHRMYQGIQEQDVRISKPTYEMADVPPAVIRRLWHTCLYEGVGILSSVTQYIQIPVIERELQSNPRGVVVLINRFLGVSAFDSGYITSIVDIFRSPLMQGMVVWDFSHSYYVPAVTKDYLISMDPSVLQEAIVDENDIERLTPPAKQPYIIPWDRLHPEVTFAFVIKSRSDLKELESFVNTADLRDILSIRVDGTKKDRQADVIMQAMYAANLGSATDGPYQFLFSDNEDDYYGYSRRPYSSF